MTIGNGKGAPPSFEEARNKRQKVRAAGMDPNYWYAVEHSDALERGQVMQSVFWHMAVAVYRDHLGQVHAVEDRCAHRQLELSLGTIEKDEIVCPYHGWKYDGEGRLTDVQHELFGRDLPKCKLKSFATRERYGLIWVFFGDADRAFETPMPEIPELEGEDRWACVPISFTCKAHHSMIIDNVSDFTHAYLHRKYKPFWDAKLTGLEVEGDKVFVSYDTPIGGGGVAAHFVDRERVNTSAIELCYDYPYQRSNTDNQIKHWLSVLPIDERTTRMFFLFYFKSFKVPFTPLRFPKRMMNTVVKIANKVQIGPLLAEDVMACEAEQQGYERHWDKPIAELNPAVHAFQDLTIRKWEEYLAREKDRRGKRRDAPMKIGKKPSEASTVASNPRP
jgi:phenylpropionate dioxygenase-like ring-hydroxylating dioxygenase large terminal subunit